MAKTSDSEVVASLIRAELHRNGDPYLPMPKVAKVLNGHFGEPESEEAAKYISKNNVAYIFYLSDRSVSAWQDFQSKMLDNQQFGLIPVGNLEWIIDGLPVCSFPVAKNWDHNYKRMHWFPCAVVDDLAIKRLYVGK